MRILILPALLASGLFGQTPASKAAEQPSKFNWVRSVYPDPLPQQAGKGGTGWSSFGKAPQNKQAARQSYFPQFNFQKSQKTGGAAEARSDALTVDGTTPLLTAGTQVTLNRPCSIPLLDVTPKDAASVDPKILVPGSSVLENVDHMPAVHVPAPSCADVKK